MGAGSDACRVRTPCWCWRWCWCTCTRQSHGRPAKQTVRVSLGPQSVTGPAERAPAQQMSHTSNTHASDRVLAGAKAT